MRAAFQNYPTFISVIAISLLAIMVNTHTPNTWQRFFSTMEDYKFSVRGRLNSSPELAKEVLLVAIDEQAINQFGRWPWPRDNMAKLLSHLSEAETIGLDVIFSESSNPQDDQILADQVAQQGNVMLGFFLRQYGHQTHENDEIALLESCAYQKITTQAKSVNIRDYRHAELNLKPLMERALDCAVFSTEPDPDGIFRHYPIGYLHQGLLYPSLAMQLSKWHFQTHPDLTLNHTGVESIAFGEKVIHNRNYLRLNWPTLNNLADHTVSAAQVLNTPNAFSFKGKTVLIGLTELGIYDMRPTPIDPVLPGVYLHLVGFSNLIQDQIIAEPRFLTSGFIVTVGIILLLVQCSQSTNLRWSGYLITLILVYFISYVLFIKHDIWIKESILFVQWLLLILAFEIIHFKQTHSLATNLQTAFSTYVAPHLVEEVSKHTHELKLGGEEKTITTLFLDIRGFTQYCENRTPEQIVHTLNALFNPFTEIIIKHNGTLDKYIGDALMAFYNAPINVESHADDAALSALEILHNLEKINDHSLKDDSIKLGLGIHTGLAVVGNFGSKFRFNYTALGDAVNVASRVESLTKHYGISVLMTDTTYQLLSDANKIKFRLIDRVLVHGRSQPISIYTQSLKGDDNDIFRDAVRRYLAGQFEEALILFNRLSSKDVVSDRLAERLEQELLPKQAADPNFWGNCYRFEQK